MNTYLKLLIISTCFMVCSVLNIRSFKANTPRITVHFWQVLFVVLFLTDLVSAILWIIH